MADMESSKENSEDAFYCLVVGSRTLTDYDFFRTKMDFFLLNQKKVVIVSGGARRGADSFAERYAEEKGYPAEIILAEWDKYKKTAGYIRNEKMHQYISNKPKRGVVAFWDGISKGTAHSFSLSKKYNNPLKLVRF